MIGLAMETQRAAVLGQPKDSHTRDDAAVSLRPGSAGVGNRGTPHDQDLAGLVEEDGLVRLSASWTEIPPLPSPTPPRSRGTTSGSRARRCAGSKKPGVRGTGPSRGTCRRLGEPVVPVHVRKLRVGDMRRDPIGTWFEVASAKTGGRPWRRSASVRRASFGPTWRALPLSPWACRRSS